MTMVYLFPNIINILSYHHIYEPNHFKVQFKVAAINLWLAYDFIDEMILTIFNQFIYTNLKWDNHMARSLFYGPRLYVPLSLHIEYFWSQSAWVIKMLQYLNTVVLWSKNSIDKIFQISLHYVFISMFKSKIHTYFLTQFVIRCFLDTYLDYTFTCIKILICTIFCFLSYVSSVRLL